MLMSHERLEMVKLFSLMFLVGDDIEGGWGLPSLMLQKQKKLSKISFCCLSAMCAVLLIILSHELIVVFVRCYYYLLIKYH